MQLNFHADTYKAVVDSPQLPQLAGKPLEVTVHVGFAGMTGQVSSLYKIHFTIS